MAVFSYLYLLHFDTCNYRRCGLFTKNIVATTYHSGPYHSLKNSRNPTYKQTENLGSADHQSSQEDCIKSRTKSILDALLPYLKVYLPRRGDCHHHLGIHLLNSVWHFQQIWVILVRKMGNPPHNPQKRRQALTP